MRAQRESTGNLSTAEVHEKQESVGVTTQGAAEMVKKREIRQWKCLEGVNSQDEGKQTQYRLTDLYKTSISNLTAAEHV